MQNATLSAENVGANSASEIVSDSAAWIRRKGWRLPKNGTWDGVPGNSNFIPSDPAALGLKPDDVVQFSKGRPDFSPWSKGDYISSQNLTGGHTSDMPKMIKTIADENGVTQAEVREWLSNQGLTPHHYGGNDFQLIPWELHGNPSAIPPINGIRHMSGAFHLRNTNL